ncbi:hypothetical protein PVT68_12250 [Microbulbifer bruguierae]|uniref:Uncharacterized protein n=1 Tax=Microbulbifer bruguierae TaxID=3029061 RepID=A0ABY8N9G2_9GAMM|nr:hypothetical protein [Microbulbifer bruguierae]WGL15541.1 hypothetical protein PVT68_12250 [Microbulbifer bruguierae]
MSDDIYQAPEADLESEVEVVEHEFYVVSGPKFLALMIVTLGWYELYWFYRHWKNYRICHKESMWPVMRAIFSIFFAHSLFGKIDASLQVENKKFSWSPGLLATVYVVSTIVSRLAERFANYSDEITVIDLISLGLFPIVIWCLYRVQMAANIACNDPQASSNANFTPANFIWLAMGALLWGLVIFGLYVGFVEPDWALS